MSFFKRIVIYSSLLILSCGAMAAERVNGVRMWPAPDSTRLVFDISGPVEHSLFSLEGPDRLVIDLKGVAMPGEVQGLDYSNSLLRGIRTGVRNDNDLRIVLDLRGKVRPKSFLLRPNDEYGHRLVVDLLDASSQGSAPVRSVEAGPSRDRDVIIVIDAGHGGEDPGALGPGRIREKDVVLAIARRLAALINKQHGMRAVLTRDGDYFIPLRKRVDLARTQRADLFISIHADAFNDPRARGASVYALSPRGASSEHASLLAAKENSSDLIGGVSLDDKDDVLASVLLDLSQTASIEASMDVGAQILKGLGGIAHLHKRRVEQAGFRVLKSPDVPSILIETAFISNPREARLLRSADYQQKMAEAIVTSLREYFRTNAPPGTVLAQRGQQGEERYTIRRGDTLSGLAQRYRVSLEELRSANNLTSNTLRIGQELRIPRRDG